MFENECQGGDRLRIEMCQNVCDVIYGRALLKMYGLVLEALGWPHSGLGRHIWPLARIFHAH